MSLKDSFVPALALMLVMEGVLPFLAPVAWREAFKRMVDLRDGQIRFMGLASMLAGIVLMALNQ